MLLKRVLYLFVFVLSYFQQFGKTAKVLVINPFFAPSHFAFLSKLADILAENGHNVTMIITEIDTNNLPTLPFKANVVIRHKFTSNDINFDVGQFQNLLWNPGFEPWDTMGMMAEYKSITESRCERFLMDLEFAESMKREKFEIGLLEPNDMCGYGFFQMINLTNYVNAIPMSLAGMIAVSNGLPGRSSEIFPNAFDYHPELSFSERFMNYIETEIRSILHGRECDGIASNVIRKLVDPNFDGNDAIAKARYLFLNTEEHIDFPRPISHKIIYIGGTTVTQSSADNLPADYKAIFANAKKGVALVSFGSIASSFHMPTHIKQAILDTFAAFPDISFIWKYENESDPIGNDLPNLYKKTWIPQKEILVHPKLLFFVTHGGMNSVLESAMAGVPLLGIPLFADQIRNIKMLEFRGSVVYVAKNEITRNSLIAAVRKLTENSIHHQRAREIAALVKANPLSPIQRFILHFNNAVEFGHTHDYLDIGHRKLNFVEFYNLDVFAAIVLVGLAITFVIFQTFLLIIKLIVQRCSRVCHRIKNE